MAEEKALEPERQIIDPHLHVWDLTAHGGDFGPEFTVPARFLLPDIRAVIAASGHSISHSVFLECGFAYRVDGPEDWRSLGETEVVAAVADEAARLGGPRISARIVGQANLLLGDAVRPLLDAHIAAAPGRFRGIRMETRWSMGALFTFPCADGLRHRMANPAFIAGARVLAAMDLSLDIWCLSSQLGEVVALADAVPDLAIVLDHCGTPDPASADARGEWLAGIAALAQRPNVFIKLGGLGMDVIGPMGGPREKAGSDVLAERWRPWIEPCIAAFGHGRAMFESNFPPDASSGSYGATWNAFKRIAAGASEAEKDALFRGTAARVYRIAED